MASCSPRPRTSAVSASGGCSAAEPVVTEAQLQEFRKTISELDAVLAVGIAAWLRKRGKVQATLARRRRRARC
jgi:3-oxoacyl-ACP reductase-like protein